MGSVPLRRAIAWFGLSMFLLGVQLPLTLNHHTAGGTDQLCLDLPFGTHDGPAFDTASLPGADQHCMLCHLRGATRATDHPPVTSLSLPIDDPGALTTWASSTPPGTARRQAPSRAPPA